MADTLPEIALPLASVPEKLTIAVAPRRSGLLPAVVLTHELYVFRPFAGTLMVSSFHSDEPTVHTRPLVSTKRRPMRLMVAETPFCSVNVTVKFH